MSVNNCLSQTFWILLLLSLRKSFGALEKNNLKDDVSHDNLCFQDNFGNLTSNSISSTKMYPEDIMVQITHRKSSSTTGTSILYKTDEILKRGEVTIFHYTRDNLKRNLTLYFDGARVYGAIGHLYVSYHFGATEKTWEKCEFGYNNVSITKEMLKSLYGFEYYEYSSIRGSSHTWYSYYLDIAVYPTNKPRGPSFDNDCAQYKTSLKKILVPDSAFQSTNSGFEVNVKQFYRVCASGHCYSSPRGEKNVTISSKNPQQLYFNQTVAICQHGFHGCHYNPRNLSLWINETNQLGMAMASLKQSVSFIYDHGEYDEDWECPEFELKDEGMQITFCRLSSSNSNSMSYSSQSDILQISYSSGCDRLYASQLLISVIWVIMIKTYS